LSCLKDKKQIIQRESSKNDAHQSILQSTALPMSSKKRALQVHHTTLIVSNIKRLYGLSVSRPALLHYLTNSAVVLPLSLTEHASGFRVCWGIWVWITEQRLGKTQNNLLLVYTTSLEKLSKNISLSGSNINDDQQTITSDKILTRVVMPILVANYNWKKNQKKTHADHIIYLLSCRSRFPNCNQHFFSMNWCSSVPNQQPLDCRHQMHIIALNNSTQ
jgi:hypothetical protein